MRHRRKGRVLGRSSSHRKAMLRNLASALFLTERDAEFDENAPKVKGRVITTVHKAKEVRPLVEKCITIARRSLEHTKNAEQYGTTANRFSDEAAYKKWRKSENWSKWADAMAPALAARRRALVLLGDKQAVDILFKDIAPRFADRPGGYTRILKLVKPRLGDAGIRAILEFVGENDRVTTKSEKPSFGDDEAETTPTPAASSKKEDAPSDATEAAEEDDS